MQKSSQRLDGFVSEITAGPAHPPPRDEEAMEKAIWSGDIFEINEQTYSFYLEGNAGRPQMMHDDWFIYSNAKNVTEPGVMFWQDGNAFFARRMDQQQWDKFLTAARIGKKFW